ncbi:hypothetical protein WOLCODRAFT_158850 [Wolfiporia cocos MD-104 SS10]|uniref:Uncharacterized protein n=1 Tax=Wolfiporia cocos (strain MD-104) TaxID=742152 RepID=A0A2H3JCJ0_WOLCO|nr:hypothetical protein WOLCODRAFT_158850 [Wolfiporia cocos MD-104 SS10]
MSAPFPDALAHSHRSQSPGRADDESDSHLSVSEEQTGLKLDMALDHDSGSDSGSDSGGEDNWDELDDEDFGTQLAQLLMKSEGEDPDWIPPNLRAKVVKSQTKQKGPDDMSKSLRSRQRHKQRWIGQTNLDRYGFKGLAGASIQRVSELGSRSGLPMRLMVGSDVLGPVGSNKCRHTGAGSSLECERQNGESKSNKGDNDNNTVENHRDGVVGSEDVDWEDELINESRGHDEV